MDDRVYTNPSDEDGDHFFVELGEQTRNGRFVMHVVQTSGGEEEMASSFITVEQVEALLAAMKAYESPPKTPEEVEAWLET